MNNTNAQTAQHSTVHRPQRQYTHKNIDHGSISSPSPHLFVPIETLRCFEWLVVSVRVGVTDSHTVTGWEGVTVNDSWSPTTHLRSLILDVQKAQTQHTVTLARDTHVSRHLNTAVQTYATAQAENTRTHARTRTQTSGTDFIENHDEARRDLAERHGMFQLFSFDCGVLCLVVVVVLREKTHKRERE